ILGGPTIGLGGPSARMAAREQLAVDGAPFSELPGYTADIRVKPALGWHAGVRVIYKVLPKLSFIAGLEASSKDINITQSYSYYWQTADSALSQLDIVEKQRTLFLDIPLGFQWSVLDSWGLAIGGHLGTGLQGRSDIEEISLQFDAAGNPIDDEGSVSSDQLRFPGPATTGGLWVEGNTLLTDALGLRFRLAHDLGSGYARAYPNTRFQLSLFWQFSPR
ncbi:MAG: hypothetical protein AAFV07_14330, partial [Bacteroidota bacterium]